VDAQITTGQFSLDTLVPSLQYHHENPVARALNYTY
jgi:hypothetical protein